MYEIFTLGGGTYLVDIFNAVAALSAGSAFANIISITAAFSLLWLSFQTAFGGSWMTNIKWYMAFLAIYLVLFTPKVTVHVTDRLNPALAGGTIDNVPYGLAAFASMTSEIGDGLTRLSESTFSLPSDLRYQETGMLFGARLVKEATKWQITDSRYSGNMSRFTRQCVFYGILLGQIDLNDLKQSPDLWQYISTTAASPLRHFEYRSAIAGGEQRDIVSCQDGVGYLASLWPQELDQASVIFGARLFPGVPASTAKAELLSRLPVAHDYLIGASRDAGEIMQQQMLINAFDSATKGWAEELGNAAALDGYMRARADLQTGAVYKTTGLQAEKWVPILKIVFESLYYGAFPIALIMMLTPIGLTVVRGYFSGFVWLQSWGPLYAILHRIMMGEAAEKATSISGGTGGAGSDGIAMVTQLGVRAIIQDTSAMAGYLSMSVPFLALGLMFGASRFAHLATSMLAPTQRAAGTAAEEGTSGNINLANTSMDNHSFHTMRGNSMQTNAMIDTGMVSNRMGDGAMIHRTADGGESIFKDRALSDPGFNVSWGSRVSQGLQQRSSEARSHAVTQAERASESMGASMGQSLAFSNTLQNSEGFNKSEGLEQRQVIANSASNIEQASERLSETTGWSQQQSLRMLGRAAVDLGTPLKGVIGSGVNLQGSGEWAANGASKDDWATVKGIAREYGVRESFEKLEAASQNLSFSEGQSQLRDQRDSMNASHSESQSAEKSLNESLNQARSYEKAMTAYKEDSGSFNANLNQMALEIGAERYGGNMAAAYQAAKADPSVAQGWADEAVDRYLDKLPVGDKTPGSLMGDIYGSRGAEGNLRHDINREDLTRANSPPGNRIDEARNQVTGGSKSLSGQMTNGSAKVGGEVQSSRATTGTETAQRSNQSLPEGAFNAGIENPGDAIDEVKKWFGTDDKKPDRKPPQKPEQDQ